MSKKNEISRPPLNRERILQAAVALADQEGLDALTMRRLGSELGVEAMSLYKHIANKDAILDGIVEQVFGEIEVPVEGAEWKGEMRRRADSVREVLTRHSWAIGLLEARGFTGPAVMRYVNAILGNLRSAGFSIDDAIHAFWLLDCYVYGHVVQETSMPLPTADDAAREDAIEMDDRLMEDYPHLVDLAEHAATTAYSLDGEFDFDLDLILDGLERLRGG